MWSTHNFSHFYPTLRRVVVFKMLEGTPEMSRTPNFLLGRNQNDARVVIAESGSEAQNQSDTKTSYRGNES